MPWILPSTVHFICQEDKFWIGNSSELDLRVQMRVFIGLHTLRDFTGICLHIHCAKLTGGSFTLFSRTSPDCGSQLINNNRKLRSVVIGRSVAWSRAGASVTLPSNVPRLWRLQDWFGTLTRPAVLGEVSKNFLLLVKQKARWWKSKNNFISFREFSIIFVVQDRVRNCQVCNKCHLFGSAVGGQMVSGTVGGGGGGMKKIFHQTFSE